MYLAEFSALAAALCWSFGGLMSTTPARVLGAVRFNHLRLVIVSLVLVAMSFATGGWHTLDVHSLLILILSAMIGIFIGDTLLFETLKRLGPRRTGILFTTNAPFTVIIGYFSLGEILPVTTVIGCLLIMVGVFLAVFYGTRSTQQHDFEKVQGSIVVGVLFGLLSALCQSVSLIIARPIMASGIDAVTASALRVGTSALALSVVYYLNQKRNTHDGVPLTRKLIWQTGLSGVVGMALGMTFLLFALSRGAAGLVSTLSATSPIFILPILWIATRERPATGAWGGAILAVIGVACIFSL
ncbi:MAG: DMT family transporter [Desulforhopalus sp.]